MEPKKVSSRENMNEKLQNEVIRPLDKMIRCSFCIYSHRDEGSIMLDCVCDKFVEGYRVFHEDLPMDGVHVENDEGWGFTVGPDFGCVHGISRI